ncbi:MAG TPA: DoxX family protein [Candidatus Dormibacteraeota bacterium]|nr:DoxX family protein [Candidatus Dormibacteraeota bacterium]
MGSNPAGRAIHTGSVPDTWVTDSSGDLGEALVPREETRVLQKFSPAAYSLLRIVTGFLFACHGAQKLFGVLGGTVEIHDPEGLAAGLIEFVGGSLVAIGLFTPIAAFIASGEMAVAYFKAHAPHGFWPIQNRGELAALFCFAFLYFACRGDGQWSVGSLVRRLSGRRRAA